MMTKPMTINLTIAQALKETIKKLETMSTEARLEAELLLSHSLGLHRPLLLAHDTDILTADQESRLKLLVDQRLDHKPLSYILGFKEFYGLQIQVSPDVLIPRPETEWLIDYIKKYCATSPLEDWTIADIGTGSGCIAIALARQIPNIHVLATDTSVAAIKIATRNAVRNQALAKITFFEGSLVEPLTDYKLQIIVANLPYIPTKDINRLAPEVKNWEPNRALDGGADGLDLYQELCRKIGEYKMEPQLLIFEIDPSHEALLPAIVKDFLPLYSVEFFKDFQGLTRYSVIRV